MKAKITRKDGTIVELEGTAEELAPFIHEPRIEIKSETATIGTKIEGPSTLAKLLEEMAKQDKRTPQWPGVVPHCPGIGTLPGGQGFTWGFTDPCSLGLHDFPSPWMSVSPPACQRCGFQAAAPLWSTICTNDQRWGINNPAFEFWGALDCATKLPVSE